MEDWKSLGFSSASHYLHSLAERGRREAARAEQDQKDENHRAWLRLCGKLQDSGIGKIR